MLKGSEMCVRDKSMSCEVVWVGSDGVVGRKMGG